VHINIGEIPEEGLTLSYEEDPISLEEGTKIEGKIGVFLDILRIDNTVSISGEIKATLGQRCSRCLKEFSNPLSSTFRVNYVPIKQIKKEGEYELKRDDLDTNFYSGDRLDLTELIKEQILLSLPMQPLCSKECKGLCLKCGKDLNEESCTCDIKEIDPRLAILKKLKG
jgi:uncharacterized protein